VSNVRYWALYGSAWRKADIANVTKSGRLTILMIGPPGAARR